MQVLTVFATSIGFRKGQGVSKVVAKDRALREFCIIGQFG